MDLYESTRKWVLKQLPMIKESRAAETELESMHLRDIFTIYINWQSRFISPQPRKANLSKDIKESLRAENQINFLDAIIKDIEAGHNLSKYLSRRVRQGFDAPAKPSRKNLKRLQHLDLMLNDWDIHHLHVSSEMDSDGFVKHGDPLLFAIFRPTAAYLLSVGTHSDFANEDLVRIAIANWPDDRLFLKLEGIRPGRGDPLTSLQRSQLRGVGMSSHIVIDGHAYVSTNALSLAGTSSRASREALRVLRTLQNFEESVEARSAELIEKIKSYDLTPSEPLSFEFALFEGSFGVIETTSGASIALAVRH